MLLDAADGPEVRGEAGAGEVGVRHAEVALLPPGGGPGVANDELLVLVVVSDTEDCVTANDLLLPMPAWAGCRFWRPVRFRGTRRQ